MSSDGRVNKAILDGRPPCAEIYLARISRSRRYLLIVLLSIILISSSLFLVGRSLTDRPDRLSDLLQLLGVAGGGTLVLLLGWWLSSWLDSRKEHQQFQTL